MRYLLFLFCLLAAFLGKGQVPEPAMRSLKGYGSGGVDQIIHRVIPTSDSGFVISINSNADTSGNLDNLVTCRLDGGYNTYFLKYNKDASVIEWCKCIYTSGDSDFIALFPQPDSSYCAVATFNSPSAWGFCINKYAKNDTLIWTKSYSKGSSAQIRDVIQTSDGGFLITSLAYYTDTNILIHYGSWTAEDIWIIKLDSNGNKQWSKVLGGSSYDASTSICESPFGIYWISAITFSNDYDCTGNHGGADLFLARLSRSGNVLWKKNFGGGGDDGGSSIKPDGRGGVYVGGYCYSSDGDVTDQVPGGGGIWLMHIDSSGRRIWDSSYASPGGVTATISRADDGSIWGIGRINRKGKYVDTAYGSDDAYLFHTDSMGKMMHARVLGSSAYDIGYLVHAISGNQVIAGGVYDNADGVFTGQINYVPRLDINFFLTVVTGTNQTSVPILDSDSYTITPNPASDLLAINAAPGSDYNIRISDATGRPFLSQTYTGNATLEVRDWAVGLYIVSITYPNGLTITNKIIINH